MTCTQINSLIIDHVDGTLDELQNQAVLSHIKTCHQCKKLVNDEQLLQRSLKSLADIEAPVDFHHTVFAGITEKPFYKTSYFAGFSSAIAASLALWMVFIPTQEMQSNVNPLLTSLEKAVVDEPGIEVALNNIENIRLSFDAPDNFKQVTLSIELPTQFELKGFPNKRNISWDTSLSAGKNVLTLPVIAKEIGQGFIKAKISNKEKSKIFKIQMTAKLGKQASLFIET